MIPGILFFCIFFSRISFTITHLKEQLKPSKLCHVIALIPQQLNQTYRLRKKDRIKSILSVEAVQIFHTICEYYILIDKNK